MKIEKQVFLFILDGCAVEEFKKAETPFCDNLMREGEGTFRCRAVFPTATYTGHASIITGNYPEKHGMVGNQFWDRINNCIRNFDTFDPNTNIESKTLFELLPIRSCTICEPITKGASIVVEKQRFDRFPPEQQNQVIFQQLLRIINSKVQFFMINFQGVDGIGEHFGPSSSEYLHCLEEVDGFLEILQTKLKSEFLFFITADHGMVDVQKNIDLNQLLEEGGFNVKCLPSHRTCHLYAQHSTKDLNNYLRTLSYIDKIFNEEDLRSLHLKHRRSGDLVVSGSEGIEFGEKVLNGSHGGASEKELNVPFIFYDSEKKINIKLKSKSVKLVDICPTILDLFQITSNSKFQGKSIFRD
ncbi:MAG: alkaline phosphatase family protein [Candidatus Helarchaeota archaeon]